MRVLAVDGVVWSAPDSADNRQTLGSGQTHYGPQPWPMVRAVCLLDTDSHELLDARLGDYDCGELTLAADLRDLDHSITLFDRAYFSAAFLLHWSQAGEQRHWLMRAKDNLRYEVVQTLGEGDWLIRISFHTARHAIVGAINTVHLARAGTIPALIAAPA